MGNQQALQRANQEVAIIKQRLESKRDMIATLVRDDHQAERLIAGALMHASDNDRIRECEPNSIVRAVVQAALVRADIAAGVGEGYLVPYNNKKTGFKECQFQPGYRLGQRRIQEATGCRVVADVRCENDHWVFSKVPLVLEHTPHDLPEGRGKPILAYAALLEKNGSVSMVEIATAFDIEQAKIASRKGRDTDSPAWRTWEDRMWRKVAIMRLAKEVRGMKDNEDLSNLLTAEGELYDNEPIDVTPKEYPQEGRRKIGRAKPKPKQIETKPQEPEPSHNEQTGEVADEPKQASPDPEHDYGPPSWGEWTDPPMPSDEDIAF